MADTKLSALTELAATPANDDEVYIRDVSEAAADESKRITVTNLMAAAGGGGATCAFKPSDESVTSSTALQNDDDLLFAIGANEEWAFQLYIVHNCSSDYDLAYAITVPAGCTVYYGHDSPGDYSVYGTSNMQASSSGETCYSAGVDGLKQILIYGIAKNGATAGNVQFQFAQQASGGTASIVKAGSGLVAHELV